ncbi:expressed unknown protein [Ectocarpus siliculosus]|uniref:Uncharacterized protein n=1 Tax=Ectocarpus siliculosus TaxID=2880 RepID=D8LCM0_ECTSI|nr:expressed unknown protein [Ectocarpus siliculosus]|eukprot:CBN79533.1 expressed unknown protein [Ectocarpus siliculosus]
MAGQPTVYYVTYTNPASAGGEFVGGGGSSVGAPHVDRARQQAPEPPPAYPYRGSTAYPPSAPPAHPSSNGARPPPPAYSAVTQGAAATAPPHGGAPAYPGLNAQHGAPRPPAYQAATTTVLGYPGLNAQNGAPCPPAYQAATTTTVPAYPGINVQHRGYFPAAPGADSSSDDPSGSRRGTKKKKEEAATEVARESRKWKWAMFVLGNLISLAVVASEIGELNVCFEENLDEDDDDTPEENASRAYGGLMFTLVLGLLVDFISAVLLSLVYRSPLDIKSTHKIPPGDMRHCGGTCLVHFVAPFSWGLVYWAGGYVSIMYGDNAPCGGGTGGDGLESYLTISGALMAVFGTGMLALSFVTLMFACCSSSSSSSSSSSRPPAARRGCCSKARDAVHKRFMSKSPIFDLAWQVQSVLLSYRAGAVSLASAFLLVSSGVVGEVLAAFGSLAPEEIQELVGPISV